MQRRLAWIPAALAGLIAIWIAADTFANMAVGHVALPFWDGWRSVAEYRALLHGHFGLQDLLSQHNEHRIAAGRLLFFVDYAAFDGRGIFLSICIAAILTALAALLVWVARPGGSWRSYALPAAATFACILSFAAYENLIWSFQAPFVLLYLAAAIGLYATVRASDAAKAGRGGGWLALAAAALIVAAYCMANGLAAAGLAVALAAALRAPRRIVAPLALLFAVLTVAYFNGYHSASRPGGLGYLLQHPGALPTYLCMFLGNLLRNFPHQEATTIAFGAFGLALGAGIAWRILVRRDLDPVRLMLAALILFALAAALASGVGRIADFGLTQALVPRYVTPTAVFWACQALYWHSATRGAPGWPRHAPAAGAGLLLILLAYEQVAARGDAAGLMMSMTHLGDAALVGVRDAKAEDATTTFPDALADDLALLRQQGKSIYAEPRAHWMGQPLSAIAKADDACLGYVDNAVRQKGDARGLGLSGWAWDTSHDRRVMQLLIVNDKGRVVGLASGGDYRGDVLTAVRAVDHVGSGWRGFALGKPSDVLVIYGLTGGGSACTVGQITAPP